jgi:hypothetical protein
MLCIAPEIRLYSPAKQGVCGHETDERKKPCFFDGERPPLGQDLFTIIAQCAVPTASLQLWQHLLYGYYRAEMLYPIASQTFLHWIFGRKF